MNSRLLPQVRRACRAAIDDRLPAACRHLLLFACCLWTATRCLSLATYRLLPAASRDLTSACRLRYLPPQYVLESWWVGIERQLQALRPDVSVRDALEGNVRWGDEVVAAAGTAGAVGAGGGAAAGANGGAAGVEVSLGRLPPPHGLPSMDDVAALAQPLDWASYWSRELHELLVLLRLQGGDLSFEALLEVRVYVCGVYAAYASVIACVTRVTVSFGGAAGGGGHPVRGVPI